MSNKTGNTLFCEISPVTHSFLLLTDNVESLIEAVHVVATRFQHLLWPQLGCLILRNYLVIGSLTLLIVEHRRVQETILAVK